MGNLGILLRKGHVFETLCKINHLIVDKTGTLTHGDIVISEVNTFSDTSKEEALAIAASLESPRKPPNRESF